MKPTSTAEQRIQAVLTADFYADDTAARRDILDALPTGPALVWYTPHPVTLPRLPETWRAVQ